MQRGIQSASLNTRKAPPPLESSDLNVSLLLRLSIDTLSCVDHRFTKEQEELGKEEKLGLFGEIFDIYICAIIYLDFVFIFIKFLKITLFIKI
jgi:hypothetical protein